MRPEFFFDKESHTYTLDGEEYPSVTTIIGATVPKNLAWWGMTVGIAGVHQLYHSSFDPPSVMWDTPEELVHKLSERGLTVNQQMKSAGVRGNAIHKALE